MKALATHMFVACVVLTSMAGKVTGQVRVSARIESSGDIYVGERFSYLVLLEGTDQPGEIDLKPLKQYDPQSTGTRKETSMRMIGPRTTTSVTTVMSYSLVAKRGGRIELPPVSVTIGGKTYNTNPVAVNVLQPGSTENLKIQVKLSEKRCYVGQPVLMSVELQILTRVKNGNFSVPVFGGEQFHIEDTAERQQAWAQTDLVINGVPVLLSERREVRNGVEMAVISFEKLLIPREPGRVEIAPVSFSADVAVGRARGGDFFFGPRYEYKRFMTSSKPIAIEVLPLPSEGRPAGFYGLVGPYTISTTAKPTKVSVGDPITLTVKVGGSRYLKPIQWPELERISEFASNFRIPSQKSSPVIEGGFKVFTQTIRASNDKVIAIPPIPLAFFDPDKGAYQVATSKPIELEVAPTKILTGNDLEGVVLGPVNREVEAIKKGLSANYEGSDVLRNQGFSPLAAVLSPGYAAIWSLPLVALVLSCLVKVVTHTSPEKAALKRRRSAFGRAVRQMKKAASVELERRHELLASSMKQYVGERFDRMAGSLTPDDCYELIVSATDDIQTADKYRETIASCEAARYASVEADVDAREIKRVIELVRRIEKKSK